MLSIKFAQPRAFCNCFRTEGHTFQRKLGQKASQRIVTSSFFVNWKLTFHKHLQDHMEHAAENDKYTSPRIQNEIIGICEGVILERKIACILKYWSLMTDETQDCSTTEQVSICVRYVSNSNEVCEDFMLC